MATHGGTHERLFSIWTGMRERCRNKNHAAYPRYGGRGVSVYEEWDKSYTTFRDWALSHGYKKDLSIDRIDNDGGYHPLNCRWATMVQQCNNKSNCNYLTLHGERLTTIEWSRKLKIPRSTILNRISRGWSVEDALCTPVECQSVLIEYNGETKELNEWARVLNIPKGTLWARLNVYKMSFEEAITKPIKRRKQRTA
jgi:hypothetical protein